MDARTENLLRDLETSPTDLKRLVITAIWRKRTSIAIEAEAIARWERDDPRRWASVHDWLLSQGITITVLSSRPAMTTYQPAPPQPPAAGTHG
ncbi:MAG: hypothetical protein DME01_23160 [Candidatus Rokuibacteriota bacterium]|nr:MAG: hypothetical protein DME01_23160 [Candidatus Rokubacteria bacterium]